MSILPTMTELSNKQFKLEVSGSLLNTTVTFGAKIMMPKIKQPDAVISNQKPDVLNQTQAIHQNQTLS